MTNRFRIFLPALIWWAFSFYLFTMPATDIPSQSWMDGLPIDKLVHIFLFTVLMYFIYRPFATGKLAPATRSFTIIIALLAVAYGIAIEYIQLYFIAHRGFDAWDMVADAAGTYLGWRLWAGKAIRGKLAS